MNAYERAIALNLVGTDAEVVAQLHSLGITNTPIDRATLVHTLNMLGMLRKVIGNNSDEKWTGTVLAMQDAVNAIGSDSQKSGFALWLSHITNPSNIKWDTTVVAFAQPFKELRLIFQDQPGMPTSADFDAIVSLGGGYEIESSFTTENYIQLKSNAEKQVIVSATRAIVSGKATAVNAWLDALVLNLKTVEEVQTYCNSLLASSDGNPT